MPDQKALSLQDSPIYGHWGATKDLNGFFEELWQCGFNSVGFSSITALPLARKYGLGLIVSDNAFNQKVSAQKANEVAAEFLKLYKSGSVFLGVYLADEPASPPRSSPAPPQLDQFETLSSASREIFARPEPICRLLPTSEFESNAAAITSGCTPTFRT